MVDIERQGRAEVHAVGDVGLNGDALGRDRGKGQGAEERETHGGSVSIGIWWGSWRQAKGSWKSETTLL